MRWQLSVRAKAKRDLKNAQDWYESQQNVLGEKFESAIDNALDVLEKNPFVYQIVHDKFRQCLPYKFPYRIIYFIDGQRVIVTRVLHMSQNIRSYD